MQKTAIGKQKSKRNREQKKNIFSERRQKKKDYPMLYKRMKEEWKGVAATEPNKRNIAAKRRYHYMMKTYDPQYKAVKKEKKVSVKKENKLVLI